MTLSLIAVAKSCTGDGGCYITHGLTIAADDVLVALCHANGAGTFSDAQSGTYPFTEVYDASTWGTSTCAMYTRVAGASEPATYTFTATETAESWSLILAQFRGVDTTNLWDLTPGDPESDWQGAGSGTTATATTRSTNYDGSMALFICMTDTIDSPDYYAWSTQNGFGTLYQAPPSSLDATAGQTIGFAAKLIATAGAIGSTAVTLDADNDWLCRHMALRASTTSPPVLTAVQHDTHVDVGWS